MSNESIFLFLIFLMGKKSNKRTQPRAAENSLTRWFPWRGQKLALCSGMPGFILPIPFIETGSFIGIYSLRQFAPVIHGNHRVRAASRWAKSLAHYFNKTL